MSPDYLPLFVQNGFASLFSFVYTLHVDLFCQLKDKTIVRQISAAKVHVLGKPCTLEGSSFMMTLIYASGLVSSSRKKSFLCRRCGLLVFLLYFFSSFKDSLLFYAFAILSEILKDVHRFQQKGTESHSPFSHCNQHKKPCLYLPGTGVSCLFTVAAA